MGRKRAIFFPLLLQLLCGRLTALDPSQPASSYIRTVFTDENGLPVNIVESATQTRDGFLWLATSMGLTRFDGVHFTGLRLASKGRTARPTYASAEGPDGDLWVGTDDGVMRIPRAMLNQSGELAPVVYHTGQLRSDIAQCLHFTRNGVLWVGTRAGLFRFDRGVFVAVIPKLAIRHIEETADGRLLLITARGFAEWDGTRMISHPEAAAALDVPEDKVFHVFVDHAGVRWYCTEKGVARETGGRLERLQPYGLTPGTAAFSASEDADGNMWLSMAGGLYRAAGKGLEPVALNIGTRSTFSDRDGNLWICTNGAGLIRFKNRLVRMFTSADGLPNNITMAVLQASDGKLWVGNNCGGLSWLSDNRFHTYSEKDGLANSCVRTIAEDRNKDLWVGTDGGGIFRFHDGRFTQFSQKDGLGNNIVNHIVPARDGSLWIATGTGLSHMRDGKFRNYTTADGLARNSIVNVHEDRNGVVWVATSSGLGRLSGDRFVNLPPVPEAIVYWLIGEDPSGGLYASAHPIGTFRISGDQFIAAPRVSPIGTAHMGRDLWFCADSLSRAAPDALQRWEHERDAPRDYTVFDVDDGLSTRECASGGYPGVTLSSDSKVWAPTWQGLAMVDLKRLPRNNRKPALYIEDVAVGQVRRSPRQELVLSPGTRHVEVSFSAIELSSPEKIHFQYRLDGVDTGWLDADATRKAIYTNFALGTHQFHVRACNSDGVWDRDGIVYNITQQPHYYETRLFEFSWISSAALLLFCGYRFRLRQVAMQMNARLDERVAERTRLARDLHDTLLQTIHASAMIAHTAHEEAGNPPGTVVALEKLTSWLWRATEEARSSLQALRSSATETNDLAKALQECGDECTSGGAMRFSLSKEGIVREMHPIVRDEIFQIGREAIRNACRHSRGSKVGVRMKYGRGLTLRIRDDGQGIERDVVSEGKAGHFGLAGMRERAARIGARLAVVSTPESGTEIELTVPGNRIFRKQY